MTYKQYDIMSKLSVMRWGVLNLPTLTINNSINPRFETNSFVNQKADLLRPMGWSSRTFDVELVFDATMGTYPDTYRRFLQLVNEGKPQILNHPILGEIMCYVSSYSDTIDPLVRSGIRARASFTETLSETESVLVDIAPTNVSSFGDFEIQFASQLPENEDNTSLFETLDQINNIDNQLKGIVKSSVMKINTSISKMKKAVNSVTSTLKLAKDTSNMLAVAALRGKLEQVEEKAPKVTIKKHVVETDVSVYELASMLEVETHTIFGKNQSLIGRLIIPRNTIVFY